MRRAIPPGFIDELQAALPARVTVNATELARHGRDESSLPEVAPVAVVMARSTEDVSTALRLCHAANVPVVPFGVGSSLEGHVLPVYGGVSLDLSEMDAILDVRPDDLLAVVQAGVRRVPLNERLARDGLFFSVDPGADATLGGMAATGASGTTTVRYGSMRDNVLALTAVMADGTVIQTGRPTRKDSAGYDLTRLLVGSEGTLAVITELTLRVFGIPERISAARCTFASLTDGVGAATAIVRMGIPVARCEFLDAASVRSVNAYEGTDLPEAPSLFFEFHGTPASVQEQAEEANAVVADFGGSDFAWTTDEGERRRLWHARHNAYPAGMAAVPGARSLTTDAAVPLSLLPEAVTRAEAIFTGQPFVWSMLGHVADGNVHALLLFDPSDAAASDAAHAAAKELTREVIALGGTCTGEHGIGLGKRQALVDQAGAPAVDVMRSIKEALDPRNILNPGKVLLTDDR
ncbi:MAG: FAD-binding oxidoreductase [Actinomycetota bacterium]